MKTIILSLIIALSPTIASATEATRANCANWFNRSEAHAFGTGSSDGALENFAPEAKYYILTNSQTHAPEGIMIGGPRDLFSFAIANPTTQNETTRTYVGLNNDFKFEVTITKSHRGTLMKVKFDYIINNQRIGGGELDVFDEYFIIP